MILYLENPNDTSRKLLGLINEYNKLSLVFLYNNNKRTEREIKETILLTIAMRRIKYLGINLPKEKKDQYIESYKTLMRNQR